jgi:hypothetical protein
MDRDIETSPLSQAAGGGSNAAQPDNRMGHRKHAPDDFCRPEPTVSAHMCWPRSTTLPAIYAR